MLDKRDLFFSFLPLAAPLVALGVAGSIAILTRPDSAPIPAVAAGPPPPSTVEAQGLQLVAERIALPPALAQPAIVVDRPVIIVDPPAVSEPPAVVAAVAAPAAAEAPLSEPRAVEIERPAAKSRLAGKTTARRLAPRVRRHAALSRSTLRRIPRPDNR